jgi:hypothetical protein
MIAKSVLRARLLPVAAAVIGAVAVPSAYASSHREAPYITTRPKVDGTDFYMFRSYEGVAADGTGGRSDYVTLIANYLPLQAPYGGPNYFSLDPDALYEIHIDNNGDAREDITFQFRFKNNRKGIQLDIGDKKVAIPLIQAGTVADRNAAALNVNESYNVSIVRGDRRKGARSAVTNAANGSSTFDKPVDNIGTKTIPDYAAYAAKHVYGVNIPGCSQPGKVFVGQRKEAFAVNLGTIFDLVNAPVSVITNPNLINAVPNTIDDANITTLALEVHKSCLTQGNEPVIGGWTTASLRQGSLLQDKPSKLFKDLPFPDAAGGAWVQMSRLSMPLVNEVVIGLPDKDLFNGSQPKDDAQFLTYVTNPTLPRLLEIALDKDPAFGGSATGKIAPTNLPRTDLVSTFLTGISGLNRPANVVPSEMMRLNTAIKPVPFPMQNRLGVAGELLRVGGAANIGQAVDLAGYPNGRRPKDDVVDISLVAVAGGLCVLNTDNDLLKLNTPLAGVTSPCKASSVPLGATSAALHDAVDNAVVPLLTTFPYLFTPTPGAGAGSN